MSAPRRCPSHPSQPYDPCPICEAKIAAADDAREYPPDDPHMSDAEAERYERWLDRPWGE